MVVNCLRLDGVDGRRAVQVRQQHAAVGAGALRFRPWTYDGAGVRTFQVVGFWVLHALRQERYPGG